MSILPITPDIFPGVAIVYFFLFLSTASLLSVLFWVIFLAVRRIFESEPKPAPREFVFFGSQLGYYAACLLIANFFNAIAGLMGVPFVVEKQITEGFLCSAQAAVQQFGNVSNGYFTTAIAVHTFNSLVMRRRQSGAICSLYIAFGWILAAAIAIIPEFVLHPEGGEVYGISGLSCGVKAEYSFFIFLFHLLPIFVASILSAVLYSLIFLSLRGTLQIKGGVKLQFNPEERYNQRGEDYQAFVAALARIMLWFPISYIALLVPYSITRLFMSSERSLPFPVMVVAYCFWFLIGFVDVFIVYKTFRVLEPAMDGKIHSSSKDVESFAATKNVPISPYLQGSFGEKQQQQQQQQHQSFPVRPLILTHDRSYSQESSTSSRRGLLVGSPIITAPTSARLSDGFSSKPLDLSRQNSQGSAFSLSAAPRRTLSSRTAGSMASAAAAAGVAGPFVGVPPQQQRQDELDVAGWLDQYVEDARRAPEPPQQQQQAQQLPLTLRLSAVAEYASPGSARSRGSGSVTLSPVSPYSSQLNSPPPRRFPRRQ